ncbi:hypothetical protein JTB14_004529 [Gonioctena quinquepunctata]|nr:hypothetical protein JTB14_004529 [Gonioctena quinquepunctata]
MDGKLGNEGKTDKRTPKLDEASPRMEKDKDEYTPMPDNNDLEDEYFIYLSSSDDELMSEESNWSNQGTFLGQTFTPRNTTGGDFFGPKIVGKPHGKVEKSPKERKSLEDPNNIEIEDQQQGKNAVHIFPIVTVTNDPMDVQGDTTLSESGNESDVNPGTAEGNEATKDYLEKKKLLKKRLKRGKNQVDRRRRKKR